MRALRCLLTGLLVLGCGPEPATGVDVTTSAEAALAYAERGTVVSSTAANQGAFGKHLAMSGDTMIVAATQEGVAYVFVRDGATFVETQRIDPWEDGTRFPVEGVVLDGDTAVIGSPQANGSGAAFVYRRSGQVWTLEKYFAGNGEYWGDQMALQGDTLLLGAPGLDATPVLAFERTGTTWSDTPQTLLPDQFEQFFATSMDLDGDTAVFGASLSNASVGAAYVFERTNGVWAQTQRLTAADRTLSGDFGNSAAIDGDTIVVGARSSGDGAAGGVGALYFFERGASEFKEVARLVAPPGVMRRSLGWMLTMDGDTVLAGTQDDIPGKGNVAGSACLFERKDGEWSFQQRLVPEAAESLQEMGWGVGLSQGIAAVGAPFRDGETTVDQGVVYTWVLLGGACDSAVDCLSGFCADGVCCDTACDGACDVCSEALGASKDGLCENAPAGYPGSPACSPDACTGESSGCAPCATDAHCPSGNYCAGGGACTPDKRKGAACDDTAGGDCEEDGCRVCRGGLPCVDGVCCDGACDGACDVCTEALGASADGTCAVLEAGAGDPTCRDGFACDGSGAACPTECDGDASCRPSHYCTSQGTCEPRTCDAASDCGTAAPYCVDGICCDEPCSGQCEACDVTAREGLCSPVSGSPHGDRAACVAEGEECGGTCDGETRARCTYGAAGTSCGIASCDGGTAQASSCDGQGACVEEEPLTCSPYACGAESCLDGCATDEDCASGYSCVDGNCVFSGGRCNADGTQALDGDGVLVKECAPYFCTNGQCGESCTSTTDCQSGFVCDTAAARCIAATSPVTEEAGGCSCEIAGKNGGRGAGAWLFAAALCGALHRRRRRVTAT